MSCFSWAPPQNQLNYEGHQSNRDQTQQTAAQNKRRTLMYRFIWGHSYVGLARTFRCTPYMAVCTVTPLLQIPCIRIYVQFWPTPLLCNMHAILGPGTTPPPSPTPFLGHPQPEMLPPQTAEAPAWTRFWLHDHKFRSAQQYAACRVHGARC